MNIAIIVAGGKGQRMKQEVPKQFLNVNDKPVIVYTLEAFQKHPGIDEIGVVCLDGWDNILWAYAKQYNITKLQWIVPAGETGRKSIHNGITKSVATCLKHFCRWEGKNDSFFKLGVGCGEIHFTDLR